MRILLQFLTFYTMLLLGLIELVIFGIIIREYLKRKKTHLLLFGIHFAIGAFLHTAQSLLPTLEISGYIQSATFLDLLFPQILLVGGIFYGAAFVSLYAKKYLWAWYALVIIPTVSWLMPATTQEALVYGLISPVQNNLTNFVLSPYTPWVIIQLTTAIVAAHVFFSMRRRRDKTRSPHGLLALGSFLAVINLVYAGLCLKYNLPEGVFVGYLVIIVCATIKLFGILAVEHPDKDIQISPFTLATRRIDTRLIVVSSVLFAIFAFALMNIVSQYFLNAITENRNQQFTNQLEMASDNYRYRIEQLIGSYSSDLGLSLLPGDKTNNWTMAYGTGGDGSPKQAKFGLQSFISCDDWGILPISGCGIINDQGETVAFTGVKPTGLSQQSLTLPRYTVQYSDLTYVERPTEVFSLSTDDWTFYLHAEHVTTDQAILKILSFVTVLTFGFFLVMVVIMFFGIRQPLRPLLPLKEAVDQLEDGKQPKIITIGNKKDELARLTVSFNRMAAAIRKRTDELNEKIRQQRDFIGLTVHELKTPLSAFRWTVEMIEDEIDTLSDEQKQMTDYLTKSSQRMTAIVNALQQVSRLDRGMIGVKPAAFDVEKLAQEVIAAEKPLADHGKIKISLDCSLKAGDKIVDSDPELIRHVMENLLSNAIKYSPADSEVKVVIADRNEGRRMRFSVSDQGIGIPKENQKDIFKKFFRAGNAKESPIEGTGLGLNISKQFIELLNGKIGFNSAQDHGSTFWFELPMNKKASPRGKARLSGEGPGPSV